MVERQKVLYFGTSGYTQPCILAICSILNSGILPESATIVSHARNRRSQSLQENHLFIFWNWQYYPVVVIPSGFASGYTGEGSKGFALAICLIREKGIPLSGISVNETVFYELDNSQVLYTDTQVLHEIKAKSEILNWPWYNWVPIEYEEALERKQLWRHQYLQGYHFDNYISNAISNIDLIDPIVGKKLRLAVECVKYSLGVESWQQSGQLIRDSWIEISDTLCKIEQIDTSEMRTDNVSEKLAKLKLDEKIYKLAKASFDLNSKVRHDRKIKNEIAMACVVSSIFIMQGIVYNYTLLENGEYIKGVF